MDGLPEVDEWYVDIDIAHVDGQEFGDRVAQHSYRGGCAGGWRGQMVAQRSRQAIVFGDDNDIALADLLEDLVQLRALSRPAGDLVSKDALRTRRLEGVGLCIEVLIVC